MQPFTSSALAGLFATAMLLPTMAHAQDAARWQFTGSLNLYLPTLSGCRGQGSGQRSSGVRRCTRLAATAGGR
jgi:hypothetical protein